MKTIFALAFATCLAAPDFVAAQDMASDNELFAAYCAGVMEKWQVPAPPFRVETCPPEVQSTCVAWEEKAKAEAADHASHLLRLRRYLKDRGYDSRRPAPAREAVSNALSAGLADGAACNSDGLEPMSAAAGKACERTCGAIGSQTFMGAACAKCRNSLSPRSPLACRLAARCDDDLSRLPY